MREGWRCPVCGAGVSPDEKRCEHGNGLAAMVPTVTRWPVRGGSGDVPPYSPATSIADLAPQRSFTLADIPH